VAHPVGEEPSAYTPKLPGSETFSPPIKPCWDELEKFANKFSDTMNDYAIVGSIDAEQAIDELYLFWAEKILPLMPFSNEIQLAFQKARQYDSTMEMLQNQNEQLMGQRNGFAYDLGNKKEKIEAIKRLYYDFPDEFWICGHLRKEQLETFFQSLAEVLEISN